MEEELTEEVEMAKRRIDEINMELNQVLRTHTQGKKENIITSNGGTLAVLFHWTHGWQEAKTLS